MSARRAIAPTPIRQPESDGVPLKPTPKIEVKRFIVTRPGKWPFPATKHWGYRISKGQRVVANLPSLTPAELRLVAASVSTLLGK